MRAIVPAVLLAAALAAGVAGAAETVRADDARIARMGRTVADADGTLRFGYAGVTLALVVEGSRLTMDAASSSANSLLDVVVDGAAPVTLRLGQTRHSYELFKDAGPGPHRVEIVHRTETWQGVPAIARFATDEHFLPAPALPSRKLLVMGDSVTCGTDMERGAGDQNTPAWWNARVSYGMLLGQALHAQVQLVCYGGRGLVRSWNGRSDEFQLPAFYDLAIPDAAHPVAWKQADYAPDLILVAIGTNDFNRDIPEHGAYVDAYTAFVRTLLRDHPQARIALTEGAILNGEKKAALSRDIADTVARVGDMRVHAITSNYHPGDAVNAHPTTPQHAAMARELAPLLQVLMGW